VGARPRLPPVRGALGGCGLAPPSRSPGAALGGADLGAAELPGRQITGTALKKLGLPVAHTLALPFHVRAAAAGGGRFR
jgi:hypothetical protein